MPRKIRLAIRGFAGGVQQFEDRMELDKAGMEQILPALAREHCKALAAHQLHMIEIEFLDEPNVDERFFRFGTDPDGMVMPLFLQLGGHNAA